MKEPVRYFHTSLRNPAINYRAGWWAVTVQVAKNKSLLGAIVGVRVVLNELGRAVEAGAAAGDTRLSERAASAAPVLISTFTSAQEREALRRALAKRKPLVAVFPAGLPGDEELPCGLATAIREGWALAISPQPPGARLNKKIATWCNEFVIRHAHEIWVGDLSPNGMLTQMLKGLGKLKTM